MGSEMNVRRAGSALEAPVGREPDFLELLHKDLMRDFPEFATHVFECMPSVCGYSTHIKSFITELVEWKRANS